MPESKFVPLESLALFQRAELLLSTLEKNPTLMNVIGTATRTSEDTESSESSESSEDSENSETTETSEDTENAESELLNLLEAPLFADLSPLVTADTGKLADLMSRIELLRAALKR